MATESTARSSDCAASDEADSSTASERARRSERRTPTARETLATLPDSELQVFDFEPHDTIPAPPWLDEPEDDQAPAEKST
jgi:hypothetical protein